MMTRRPSERRPRAESRRHQVDRGTNDVNDRQGAKQKDFLEPPTIDRKELVIQTPKLEGLVSVAKQAIERLREKKKSEVSQSEETEGPPAKRQLMSKGQSKVTGKGKSSAPATTVSTTSTVTKVESTVICETPKIGRMETKPRLAPRLPPCEKQSKSQVDVDLVLSTEASETETENYADVFVAGREEQQYSDVEPTTPERAKVSAQPPEVATATVSAMVPEILEGFTESILIEDDDDKAGLVMDIPSASEVSETLTVSADPLGTAMSPLTLTPARESKTESITSPEIDVTARIPMKPAKVHTPKRKQPMLNMPEIVPVTQVSMDVSQRNVKTISGLHLASAAMNFNLSTIQVAEQLSIQYVLDDEQRMKVVQELQKIRLGAKTLALKIRSEFPLNARNENDRIRFLDWLEENTRMAASHDFGDHPVEFESSTRLPARF